MSLEYFVPPESITFKREESAALAISAGDATDAADVNAIVDGLTLTSHTNPGVLPRENAKVYTAQGDYDQCKIAGIKEAFKQQLEKVSKDGIFVFVFIGPAVYMAPNDSSPANCCLQPVDFKQDNINTHLTAGVIGSWLASVPTKPKHLLIIVDTPFAEKFTEEMAIVNKQRVSEGYSLCVLRGHDGPDKPVKVSGLSHSIFSYFLYWAFHETVFASGQVPLRAIFKKTTQCCDALSSLIVTYNHKTKTLNQNIISPRARYTLPETFLRYLMVGDSSDDTDETDGPLNVFEFLMECCDRKSAAKITLHEKARAYLETVGDLTEESPLSKLKKHGLLQSREVLYAVVSCLMSAIASILVAEGDKSVSDPNQFIYSFMMSVAAISAVQYDVEFAPAKELFRRSREGYLLVVRDSPGMDDKKLTKLFQTVDMKNN